jgi:hypothetical protein
MSRIARFAVLVAALASLFAVMSSTAGAVTWTNEGNTQIHATGAGGRLHIGANTLACTGATATGDAPVHSAAATYVATGHVIFTPCTLVGQSTFVSCSYSLTGAAFTGATLGGVTTGAADVTCDARLEAGGIGLCHIEGSTAASYTNPSAAGGTGRLTLSTSTTLTVTNFGSTNCPLGTGTGTLTHQQLTTTAGFTPILVRHA